MVAPQARERKKATRGFPGVASLSRVCLQTYEKEASPSAL